MGAKMSVLGLLMSFPPYLRSAMVRFPLTTVFSGGSQNCWFFKSMDLTLGSFPEALLSVEPICRTKSTLLRTKALAFHGNLDLLWTDPAVIESLSLLSFKPDLFRWSSEAVSERDHNQTATLHVSRQHPSQAVTGRTSHCDSVMEIITASLR